MGFFDQVLRRVSEFIRGIGVEQVPTAPATVEPSPEFDDTLTRKFVSGLFYCGGQKVTYFALTFDEGDDDLEQELLNAMEEENSDFCSELRTNFGYSEEEGFPLDSSPQYPDIEVGTL